MERHQKKYHLHWCFAAGELWLWTFVCIVYFYTFSSDYINTQHCLYRCLTAPCPYQKHPAAYTPVLICLWMWLKSVQNKTTVRTQCLGYCTAAQPKTSFKSVQNSSVHFITWSCMWKVQKMSLFSSLVLNIDFREARN